MLVYPARHDSFGKPLAFTRICAETSLTRADQKTPSDPLGLTLVAFLPPSQTAPFEDAIKSISNVPHNFRHAVENLHFTIRGLFFKESWDVEFLREILPEVQTFFQGENLGRLHVSFDLVRPGLWPKHEGCSNGTVVALTTQQSSNKIMDLSKRVADFLSKRLPHVFPKPPGRPLPGVWCTLGYFDDDDFGIDGHASTLFDSLRAFRASVELTELALTEFALKSLADSQTKGTVRL